jgi:hypothetical protein
MPTPTATIPLPEVPRALRAATGASVPYRMIYAAVLDARIPAEKLQGRWHVARADLPRIAQVLADVPAAA